MRVIDLIHKLSELDPTLQIVAPDPVEPNAHYLDEPYLRKCFIQDKRRTGGTRIYILGVSFEEEALILEWK